MVELVGKVGDPMARTDILSQKETIIQWVEECLPKAEIARRLKCNIDTLNRYLSQMNITYKGNQGSRQIKTFANPSYLPFEQYVNREGVNLGTNKIRKKLLKEGLKEARCEHCGNTEWEGQPIPLEVHHVDGDRNHNALSNLQLLCPNCHALTPTYRGKNIKKKTTAV